MKKRCLVALMVVLITLSLSFPTNASFKKENMPVGSMADTANSVVIVETPAVTAQTKADGYFSLFDMTLLSVQKLVLSTAKDSSKYFYRDDLRKDNIVVKTRLKSTDSSDREAKVGFCYLNTSDGLYWPEDYRYVTLGANQAVYLTLSTEDMNAHTAYYGFVRNSGSQHENWEYNSGTLSGYAYYYDCDDGVLP